MYATPLGQENTVPVIGSGAGPGEIGQTVIDPRNGMVGVVYFDGGTGLAYRIVNSGQIMAGWQDGMQPVNPFPVSDYPVGTVWSLEGEGITYPITEGFYSAGAYEPPNEPFTPAPEPNQLPPSPETPPAPSYVPPVPPEGMYEPTPEPPAGTEPPPEGTEPPTTFEFTPSPLLWVGLGVAALFLFRR